MKTTALCLGASFTAIFVLASGCDDSGGESKSDGGGGEAGSSSDTGGFVREAGPVRDGIGPGPDMSDVPLVADGPGYDATGGSPGLDGPAMDGAARDVPIGSGDDGGGVSPIDGQPTEAGTLPPLVYPDGGLSCGLAGAICQSAADCCGLACVSNRCAAGACLSDGTACTSGGECCSTMCGSEGTCVPLNPTCKTAGNACQTGTQCCSGFCNDDGQCAVPGQVSFCVQVGDICRGDSECCTGVCQVAAGAAAGTCANITTSCQIDGMVCDGCGTCCSHFCGPFGASGPDICQPASGCHVQGDLCRQDSDCCGGDVASGLPGAGLVRCEPDLVYGGRIGICGGPKASNCPDGSDICKNACNPEGNVCHYTGTAICGGDTTSKRNDCCDCVSGKECCKPDLTGIPRCNSLDACVPVGGHCSFSGECCDHLPCVPDPVTGTLVCGASCVPQYGACTTNADCCSGMLCEVAPGALVGMCIIPGSPPVSTPDGGVPEVDAGQPDAPPPICAFYGQQCSVTLPCCGATSCVNTDYTDCTAVDSFCFCFSPE